ncbi:phosphoglucomutase/phosphomannomutase alpha/beta/alpha domain I [Hymenobacter roseosalivarius DSM 11622]|uniref:Phosphoglucomutase/phosphomannomutase alpha/beta/alpha domain I n=1 Tax=Hymenobacter roseosalivarius DSM 11622 TaxID=645990 RepID=A0A1W1VY17_9BACT|nr:phospho-sugar mutase [Hymenobacter roseosalivarius]SMB98140.1 phosphoglucomutase/phosphomannomutase alpha/beta/alpha domain I [Hymenobacter roseosalivarius DSM 11622]
MALPSDVQQKINTWLTGDYDAQTQADIQQLLDSNQEDALNDAFYRDLEFGTGGLRGVMGTGSNRMNRYTLGMATQGLCNYLLESFPAQEIKVAVAHDSRNNSPEFARIAGGIFSANGITVYLFEALRPTPELSYTIRHLGCQSGVVITASHNPKEYNGYKVYWNDGAQVVAPHDKNIIREVNEIQSVNAVKFQADESRIHLIGGQLDDAYLSEVQKLSINPEAIKRQHDLKIVFTPIHGTGITLVPKALERFGFTNVSVVEAQATPDGNFPTVVSPNPEEKAAMQMALDQARQLDADLVIATDPDADRVGIAVKNTQGEWVLVNGNQTAALLTFYLLSARKNAGKMTEQDFIVYTIVTSEVLGDIAKAHGVKSYQTLTGFKYIAGLIRDLEGKETYIGGGEESYGFMIGDFVRDKDAVSACAMIAEMAAVAKDNGRTLYEEMVQMYATYGLYREDLISLTKKGQRGAEEIQEMMRDLRAQPPHTIAGSPVVELRDYQTGIVRNLQNGQETRTGLESSNVLQFLTEDGSKISARPSGTEPKIKFYFSVKQPLDSVNEFEQGYEALGGKIARIIEDMQLK